MRKNHFRSIPRMAAVSILLFFMLLSQAIFSQSQGLPPAGHLAQVNGIEMYYEEYGQGEPLVLLHGFFGSGANWAPFIPELAQSYHLIIPDLRGHGRSTNPRNEFTHRQSALDVYALMDRLGIGRFKAAGVSSGGMTLLHMATQQPDRVEAMILIGATTCFPEQARNIMRQATVESLSPQEWEFARKIHKHGDEQIRALRLEFHNFKDSYEDMNFTAPYLSTIKARTFIVHGDRDLFFPVSIPIEMYESIPRAYLWIVPNGNHVPIIERQAEFMKEAEAFLRGDWEKR
jgi:pimeloyl-ACP methyl ester carboxylesterase